MHEPDPRTASRLVRPLWAAYVAVLPFHRVWRLPWFGLKLQPPEIIFLGLAAVSIALLWRGRRPGRLALADVAVSAWVGANVVALLFASGPWAREAVIEACGAVYLAGLYAAIRITSTPRLLDRFSAWFSYSAMAAAALGIIGVVVSWIGYPTRLSTTVVLPYVGLAARAQAFTAGPGMLSSILLMAVPLFLAGRIERRWNRRDVAGLAILTLGLIATVSKTALCLTASLSVMWACGQPVGEAGSSRRSHVPLWSAVAVSLCVAMVMAVASHVMVLRDADVPSMSTLQLVGGRPIATFHWRGESWVLIPTTYTFNNEASLVAIARTWPAGVGPAGQPAFTAMLQREGRFPPSILMKTPHSTYLGTAAERGVAGVAALMALLTAAGITIHQLLTGPARRRWEAAAFAGIGTGFLIEALSTDLLNCRHYWLLLAVVVARSDSVRSA